MITNHIKFFVTLSIGVIMILVSCDRPECKNTNPVFEKFKPESQEYRKELARQIQIIGAGNLRYWVSSLIKKDGEDFLELYIQGDGLCAKLFGRNNSSRFKWVNKDRDYRGGYGWRGAKLIGVEIKTQEDSTGTDFIIENIERIID
jgi:hypothetical protein